MSAPRVFPCWVRTLVWITSPVGWIATLYTLALLFVVFLACGFADRSEVD